MPEIEKLFYINEHGEKIEFSTRSEFHVNVDKDVSGLSDIHSTIYTINSMGQDGDTDLGGRIKSRDIEIIGNIKQTDKPTAFNMRRRLNRVLNPHLKGVLIYEFGDFRRVIDCRVEDSSSFKKDVIFHDLTIQLFASNPFWRDEMDTREDIAAWIGTFEFEIEIPIDEGMEFGYREPSLIKNIENIGDVRCGIRFDFRALGTVSTPSIKNLRTREFIKINITLQAGDILSVTTHYGKKEVKLYRGAETIDAFRYLDPDSTYIQLEVGDNLFRYDAASNLEGLEVSINRNNYYLGV